MSLIIDEKDLKINNARRVPTVLCIDKSQSMGWDNKLPLLNQAIKEFYQELRQDPLTKYAIDLAVIEFNSTVTASPGFKNIRLGEIPQISDPSGTTHLAEAVDKAVDILEDVKAKYKAAGIGYYQPWLVIISDGKSEGESPEAFEAAAKRSRTLEANKKLTVIPAFIGNPEPQVLADFSKFSFRNKAQGFDASKLSLFFRWFSQSLSTVAHSDANAEPTISFDDFKAFLESMDNIG